MESRTADLGGPVHYIDFGGEGPAMVLLHGLGGSHPNWLAVGPRLAERCRVFAPDLVGFGRTPPAGRQMNLRGHRELIERFLDEVVGGPAILMGNSTGGVLSIIEAASAPERVAGLILLNPALPRANGSRPDNLVVGAFAAYAVPGVGERFVRLRRKQLGPEGIFRETMRLCCVDPSRVSPDIEKVHVELLRERFETMPWADLAFLRTARSLLSFLARKDRAYKLIGQVTCPTLYIHGAADRLVPLGSAKAVSRMRRDWSFVSIQGVGHVPMLEAPDRVVEAVDRWLEGPGRGAAMAAAATPAAQQQPA